MSLWFRIDDVSMNTDLDALGAMLRFLRLRFPSAAFLIAVSPVVVGMDSQRIFPKEWTPRSDRRDFYRVTRCGVPDLGSLLRHETAAHGLVHVDHRLLGYDAQELSILVSCSLVGAAMFVPPFNYWNRDTEAICAEHAITLIKYEDGWRHLHHSTCGESDRVYFHPHDTTLEDLQRWAG